MEREFSGRPAANPDLLWPTDALGKNPAFFEGRDQRSWRLRLRWPSGYVSMIGLGADFVIESPTFGRVVSTVYSEGGHPVYDTIKADVAKNVDVVAYSVSKKGKLRILLVSEQRPLADDPYSEDLKVPVFWGIPGGFINKGESVVDAAKRETEEETGAEVLGFYFPKTPKHNFRPAFAGTWDDIVFIRVSPKIVGKIRQNDGEQIYKAKLIDFKKALKQIKKGKTKYGYTRNATSNSAILIFEQYRGRLIKSAMKKDKK